MQNDNNVVDEGTILHVAYHPFNYPGISPYVQCPHQGDYGWMQQGGPDLGINYQVIVVCEVTLIWGH